MAIAVRAPSATDIARPTSTSVTVVPSESNSSDRSVHSESANDETAKIAQRVLGAMLENLPHRHQGGPTPFGYRVEYEEVYVPGKGKRRRPVKLVPCEKTAKVVQWMFAQAAAGKSLREIAEGLRGRGVTSPKGAPVRSSAAASARCCLGDGTPGSSSEE